MNRKKTALEIFLTFFKIGLFTFGGGYAMIPLIQKEMVENHKWITDEEILEMVAISESTPGPIAINIATFVGYRICGTLGSFCATIGVVIPSFLVIVIISFVIKEFQHLKAVRYAFMGIRAGVLALIAKAMINMYKQCPKSGISYFIMFLAFVAVAVFDINVLFVIVACAIIGLVSSKVIGREDK